MVDSVDYRLALVLPLSRQIIALQVNGTYVLPLIAISLSERPTQQLNRLIEEQWSIKSVVVDLVHDDHPDCPCAVIEVRTSTWDPYADGFSAVVLDKISDENLGFNERAILHSILAGTNSGRGPFSHIGWIEDVRAWVHEVTTNDGVNPTGEMLQFNAGGGFCLIRFATANDRGFWLKATGEPNTREFNITRVLSGTHPRYLPRLIAAREDWNAWLSEEHGNSLFASGSLEQFRQAVREIANLQKAYVGRADMLLAAQCGDHRDQTLKSRVSELIEYLDEAMELQTSLKVPKLSSSRLSALERMLHDACALQQDLAIPDSLIHGDINPGNILYDGNRFVFTDWSEGRVGNPFIILEQLCAHIIRRSPNPDLWSRVLRDEYKAGWLDLLTELQIDRGFQLAPVLSILSSLHDRGDWLDSPKRYHPQRLSYSRSLARHIDRVAQSSGLLEALCH